jgi:hypothetical protein
VPHDGLKHCPCCQHEQPGHDRVREGTGRGRVVSGSRGPGGARVAASLPPRLRGTPAFVRSAAAHSGIAAGFDARQLRGSRARRSDIGGRPRPLSFPRINSKSVLSARWRRREVLLRACTFHANRKPSEMKTPTGRGPVGVVMTSIWNGLAWGLVRGLAPLLAQAAGFPLFAELLKLA